MKHLISRTSIRLSIKHFTLLLILIAHIAGLKAQPEVNISEHDIIVEFEKQLEKDVSDDDINGSLSAAIVKEGKIIWSKASGYSDPFEKSKADTSTVFRIASITKSFTAFLLMQLYQDKVLDINDPVENYFPEIKELKGYSDTNKITFYQLATHTAGLIREPKLKGAASGSFDLWEEKIIQSIPKTEIKTEPGTRFKYSNIGYGILGLAISRAANKTYSELLKQKIFQPLNMTNSFLVVPDEMMTNVATGIDGGPLGEIDYEYPMEEHKGRGYKVPNGGIYTNPNDLAKFMMCNLGYYQNLLDSTNLAFMQSIQTPENDYWDNYGIGYFIYKHKDRVYVGHSGSISGYSSYFLFDKDSKYGVIILRNYNWGITELEVRSVVTLDKLNKIETKD